MWRATPWRAGACTLTLGDIPADKATRRALDEIFSGCREDNGRLKARLDDALREPERWRPLAELLGLCAEPQAPAETPRQRLARALQRLKLLHPDDAAWTSALSQSEALPRFFRDRPTAEADLVRAVAAAAHLRASQTGLTLSELGTRFFNDSKSLRGGPLRALLFHLLRERAGGEGDEAALFSESGLIENPYTAHAALFAPVAYRTRDGAWLDWPYRLWQRGEASLLSWQTVSVIDELRLEASCGPLVTSENAAPFHRLVEARQTALYTAGYPNAAVRTLLRLFAQAGMTCRHWGDTDLDGYRIAEQVARCLPTEPITPPATASKLTLTEEQHQRLERFITANPDYRFLDGLRHTLTNGWVEQEQTIEHVLSALMRAEPATQIGRLE